MIQGWIFQGHFPCSRKVTGAFFLLRGWNCVPSPKNPNLAQMEILQGRTIPYMLHGDEGCAVIVSFQGVLGRQNDANLPMDCHGWPVEFQEKNWFLKVELWSLGCAPSSSSGCFGKLWLPRSVAQQVVRGWNMLESLNNRTLHFVCQLLEYASSSAMYCVHVPVQLLGWNVAQLASMKKSRAFGMSDLKSMWSRIFLHHG